MSYDSQDSGGAMSIPNDYMPVEAGGMYRTPVKILDEVESWKQEDESWRPQCEEDWAFIHGDQWPEKSLEVMRKQKRPAGINGRLMSARNRILGQHIVMDQQMRIAPRGRGDAEVAAQANKLIEWIAEQNDFDIINAQVLDYAIYYGIGFYKIIENPDPLSFVRTTIDSRDPRDVFFDPKAKKKNFSDSRGIFEEKWVDLDVAQAMFPAYADELEALVETKERDYYNRSQIVRLGPPMNYGDYRRAVRYPWTNYSRKQVRLVEFYRRIPHNCDILVSDGVRVEYKPGDPLHENVLMMNKRAYIQEGGVIEKMYTYLFCRELMLSHGYSKYNDNMFPYVANWYYMDQNYKPYGMARLVKDSVRELNKRKSLMLQQASGRGLIIGAGSGVKDPQAFAEKVADPNSVLLVPGDINQVRDREPPANLQVQKDLYSINLQEVFDTTAPEDSLGLQSDAESAVAIRERKQQSSIGLAPIFLNERYARKQVVRLVISRTQQFMDHEIVLYVTESDIENGTPTIFNSPVLDENGEESVDEYGDPILTNDFSRAELDVKIIDGDRTSEENTRQVEIAFNIAEKLAGAVTPTGQQVGLEMLIMAIENSTFGNRKEIVNKLRSMLDAVQQNPQMMAAPAGENPDHSRQPMSAMQAAPAMSVGQLEPQAYSSGQAGGLESNIYNGA